MEELYKALVRSSDGIVMLHELLKQFVQPYAFGHIGGQDLSSEIILNKNGLTGNQDVLCPAGIF